MNLCINVFIYWLNIELFEVLYMLDNVFGVLIIILNIIEFLFLENLVFNSENKY